MWLIKFKATLSPIKMFSALPSIIAIRSFFFTNEPSFFLTENLILLSIRMFVLQILTQQLLLVDLKLV
jgi:hypothetical protein